MAHVELSTKPFLTMDEVQHIQRQQIVSLMAHVFRLAYATMVDSLVHEEKMRNCHGPEQTQASLFLVLFCNPGKVNEC